MRFLINDAWVKPVSSNDYLKGLICTSENDHVRNYLLEVPHYNDSLEFRIVTYNFYADTKISIRDLTIIAYSSSDETVFSKEFNTNSINVSKDWAVVGNKAN